MSGSVAAVKIVVACLCAALAACSGGANSDEIVELTTTSPAVESTTAPSSTTSSTTTEAPTTTTTEPQTTSTTTAEDLAAEIEADLQAGRDLTTSLAEDPSAADLSELSDWLTDPILTRVMDLIASNSDAGIAWRSGPTMTNEVTVEAVSVVEASGARVVFCLSNDIDVYSAETGNSINSDQVSIRYTAWVERTDDVWKLSDAEAITSFEGFGCTS